MGEEPLDKDFEEDPSTWDIEGDEHEHEDSDDESCTEERVEACEGGEDCDDELYTKLRVGALEQERALEKKIQDAIAATQQENDSDSEPTDLKNYTFGLVSSEYMDRFYTFDPHDPVQPWEEPRLSINFRRGECEDEYCGRHEGTGGELIQGFIEWATSTNFGCRFHPFRIPRSRQLGKETFTAEVDEWGDELTFKFFGNEYLELEVTKGFLFCLTEVKEGDLEEPLDSLPDVFKFVGEIYGPPGCWSEGQTSPAAESPRDSWFESNHPMGAYYDPMYAEY